MEHLFHQVKNDSSFEIAALILGGENGATILILEFFSEWSRSYIVLALMI